MRILYLIPLGLEKAITEKKLGSMIGVESGHAIGSSIAVLRTIYELGGRYMTLTHSCNTPWYVEKTLKTSISFRVILIL